MEYIINKIKKIKNIHIAIIVIGIIFISLSIFHSNLWFDESYSVAIAGHSFSEIWKIGGNDVHPILYYFCLHIINLIFGQNIIAYRIFSMIPIAILGILGLTHIRKDFGEKTGLLFSFFTFFLPFSSMYSGEIRMYSLGLLLGTIMAIYAYRIYKEKSNKITIIIFAISSLLVSYTHYYGLMLAGIINLLLFIFLIKNKKERKEDLIIFSICAVIQVIAYTPWLICFLTQLKNVSKGFWITLTFPGTLEEILTTQYRGNLPIAIPIIVSIILYIYLGYLIIKTKKPERKPATWGLLIYISIILIALTVSICMKSVILLYRYLLIITGAIIFALAFFMAKDTKKWRIGIVITVMLVMSAVSNFTLIQESYNSNNYECVDFINQNIKQGDIICYSNAINGAVITTQISTNKDNKSYFYNKDHWGVEEAYKAYKPYMEIKDSLEEILDKFEGRIWIVESGNTDSLLSEISEKYQVKVLESKQFEQEYKKYNYTIELVEK